MFYVLDVIKFSELPWFIFLVYAAISKNFQKDCVYALAATRKRQVAPEHLLQTHSTFNKSVMMAMCVSKLWSEDQWRILPWDASDSPVMLVKLKSVESSLSSSMAMFLLTERARLSTFRNETPAFIFTRSFATQLHRSECCWLQNTKRNAAAGLASSWRWWTEAALDQCLASSN